MSRRIRFQYHLLRGGAFCAYLRADKSTTPVIRMDDGGEIKTSFAATFAPDAVDADGNPVPIDWLSDEIQPVMIINGVQHKLGVFSCAKSSDVTRMKSRRVEIQAYDRGWKVRDTKQAELLYWPSGTPYLTAIGQLINAAGAGAYFATPNAAVFAEDREDWTPGVSYLEVVNELLQEINYKPLYFNVDGFAVLEPVSMPTAADIKHVYDSNDPETLLIRNLIRESDVYSTPNVFIAYCANPDKNGNMTSTAVNDNPQSPLSVQRRGRQIVELVQVNNIASQDALDDYAEWLRDKSMIRGELMKFPTGLRPDIGVADAVGLVYDTVADIGIEHAYTMNLEVGGRMEHTVERIVYNLE